MWIKFIGLLQLRIKKWPVGPGQLLPYKTFLLYACHCMHVTPKRADNTFAIIGELSAKTINDIRGRRAESRVSPNAKPGEKSWS